MFAARDPSSIVMTGLCSVIIFLKRFSKFYIHTWHVTMYGYSTSFFSPSGPKGDFRRRNLFSLEIRGVYGVFPRRAGPQARGPGEPFGQDRLKSGSAFFNIIPQTSPKQNCSPERASMWPACVLHLLVLCPLVAHAP